ncbi:hypothetical protein [Hymenobacter terricola]|uniref:hypothetical protein n=1 Tax=Hymenobacter terricola TaxID=2819236 RepID=UPI001B31815E|nr:hypothetical protein [Hymenobacter terricola]
MHYQTIIRRFLGAILLFSLVLLLLRQSGLAALSWWVVTSPLWGPWLAVVLVVALGVVYYTLLAAFRKPVQR